jgi:hypothetical protein
MVDDIFGNLNRFFSFVQYESGYEEGKVNQILLYVYNPEHAKLIYDINLDPGLQKNILVTTPKYQH